VANRSRRQLSWYAIATLATLDLLLLAVAPAERPGGTRARAPLTVSESDSSQIERMYAASGMVAEPGIRTQTMKSVLYRTGQTSQIVKPPCNQIELTYGQVDPCG